MEEGRLRGRPFLCLQVGDGHGGRPEISGTGLRARPQSAFSRHHTRQSRHLLAHRAATLAGWLFGSTGGGYRTGGWMGRRTGSPGISIAGSSRFVQPNGLSSLQFFVILTVGNSTCTPSWSWTTMCTSWSRPLPASLWRAWYTAGSPSVPGDSRGRQVASAPNGMMSTTIGSYATTGS